MAGDEWWSESEEDNTFMSGEWQLFPHPQHPLDVEE